MHRAQTMDNEPDDLGGKTVIREVAEELTNQDLTWGEQNHEPLKWVAILVEEVGEAARAILKQDDRNYRDEMVQVAAVAIKAIESFDRRTVP